MHAFVVPLRRDGQVLPGIRIEDCGPKMGLDGVDNGRIWFDRVRVPRANLLDRFADVSPEGVYASPIDNPDRRFFTMLGTLVQGRVCVGGAGINAAKVAITLATTYAGTRRQFEATAPPAEDVLLDYGLHQRRLLPAAGDGPTPCTSPRRSWPASCTTSSPARPTTSTPGVSSRRGRPAPRRSAPGTRRRTIQECREACGGAGYLSANRFAALKADTDVFTTFEGDNHVLLQLVAKGLLTDYASDFEDLDQFGMVRFVASMAVETVIEKTNVHKLLTRLKDVLPGGDEWDQEAGLLDPNYQLAMLRFREEHMLAGVARRLKRGIDDGLNPGEVFSRVQDHVIAAANAHVERLVLDAFVEKCRAVAAGPGPRPQGRARPALRPLRADHDRGRPGLVHGARPAVGGPVQGDQPRGQRPVPQGPAPRAGLRRRARRPARDAARARSARPGVRLPAWSAGCSGPWVEDPLWATAYDWLVEHETVGGLLWRLGTDSSLADLYAAADEIGRLPAGSRVLDVPCGGGVALRGLRPDQGVEYVAADIAPAMLDRTVAAAARRGVLDQVRTAEEDLLDLSFADDSFDLVVSLTGLHVVPDPRARGAASSRGCSGRAAGSPGAR